MNSIINLKANHDIINMSSERSLRIAMLGYANSALVPPWDPSNCEKGLPGSEECAVYGSQELANRGHQVTVYMNPPPNSAWTVSTSNPRWVHIDTWDDSKEQYDLVLMWRRFDVDTGRKRGKIVFFYPHDSPPSVPPGARLPPFPRFDGLCILSEHHRRQFNIWPGFNTLPYVISGNGVVPDHFTGTVENEIIKPTCTNPYSMGYFSNYARGLIVMMLIWPEIRSKFPEATLDIYYGRETWGTMPEKDFNFVIEKINQYKDAGVTERGKIGHLELAKEMQRISIWVYPCSWPIGLQETFCITAVKAQMAGCIPVTTRIAALNETVHPEAPSVPDLKMLPDIIKYKEKLLETLQWIQDSDPKIIQEERRKYIEYSQQFKWSNCVDKWLQLYDRVAK
jgi:glycosyltransferase involved in cell wall biosynthesis